jgi:hypothetical protein
MVELSVLRFSGRNHWLPAHTFWSEKMQQDSGAAAAVGL